MQIEKFGPMEEGLQNTIPPQTTKHYSYGELALGILLFGSMIFYYVYLHNQDMKKYEDVKKKGNNSNKK